LPNGILDKGIPNCGATTLALKDNHKTIIVLPRVNLLINKHEQTPGSLMVMGGVLKDEIKKYINTEEVPKILVTYDSVGKVIDCIEDLSNWRVVVDEFQYIIVDGNFKSETEKALLEKIRTMSYVTYLSATPCLDKLLEQIDSFKNIDYYQLIWENVEKVKVIRQRSPYPIKAAVRIVEEYKKGAYPSVVVQDKTVYSKECVIFVNSVKNILSIIKTTKLKPEEVNIIVGNPMKNESEIKTSLGEAFEIGYIPLNGEKHKIFTFCTSTTFAGCDFYSTCASTFVISDCNRTNTTIDISTDLVQIAGRQRLECNPFRKYLTFVYNMDAKKEDENYLDSLKKKCEQSRTLVDYYNGAPEDVKPMMKSELKKAQNFLKYSESYAMLEDMEEDVEFNYIAYISEQYEYLVRAYQYENGITIKESLVNNDFELLGDQRYMNYEEQLEYISQQRSFEEMIKQYCEARDVCKGLLLIMMDIDHTEFKYYYEQLGSKRIKALGYKESALKKEIAVKKLTGLVCNELNRRISDGSKMTNKEIRNILNEIYKTLGIDKAAKATDLKNLYGYDIKECKIKVKDNDRDNGYIISKIKLMKDFNSSTGANEETFEQKNRYLNEDNNQQSKNKNYE
jgi:hypothetical protein